MTENNGHFKKGQSGNPNGRPKKERALTTILEQAGSKTLEVEGKRVSGKHLVARMAWELVTTGATSFPGGLKQLLTITDIEDWLSTVKWLYTQIDGPPKTNVKVEGDPAKPLEVKHEHSIDPATIATVLDIYTKLGLADQPGAEGDQDSGADQA